MDFDSTSSLLEAMGARLTRLDLRIILITTSGHILVQFIIISI